jgi:FAD/FMN-containing dehydrogenase
MTTSAAVATAPFEELAAAVRGDLITPADPGYDQARAVYNAMIDKHPAAIVRCRDTADVIACVRFAREHGVEIAVRGGGHSAGGLGVADDALVIDLSQMRSTTVDPENHTVRADPGCTWGDVDHATVAFGMATPSGFIASTGVAGLALGGGIGYLSRRFGLTVDNLLSADVVLADGTFVTTSEHSHPDLFWALRGGGGNFGVVTSFEFRLHPVGPQVIAGLIVHPFSAAKDVLHQYRRLVAQAPDELCCWAVMRKAPPLPFLPPEVHGTEVLVLALCHSGDLASGEKAAAPFRAIGKPIADVVGPAPFAGWQTAFDPLLTAGERNYWKSHDFVELSDGLIDVLLDAVRNLPTPQCEIFIGNLGGAINRVAADATAYPHRNVNFVMNVHTRWSVESEDKMCVAWGRAVYDATAPFATGGVYVNFMPNDEADRVRAGAYGVNFDRLAKIKAKYDPANLFRMNQNVAPAR